MKNKISSNLMLKIISVIVAFLLWLVIINLTDPITSRTFTGIPVKVLNESVITSVDQVYEIEEGDKVSVKVKGKRSVVETILKTDFEATADMSDLSKVNAVNIQVKMKKSINSNVEIDSGNAMMKVKLEKRVTQKFQVKVEHQGDLSQNYVLGEIVAKPNIVEVSCGESKFKRIDHVGVLVRLNGESDDFVREYSPVLYDKDGDIIDNNNVTFSNDIISVSTEVLGTKEVPVYVQTTGEPAPGYRLIQTDFRPDTIRVSGTQNDLKKVTSVKIDMSVEGAQKDVEREFLLTDYLPAGLTVVGDTETISIRCEIMQNGTRQMIFSSADIAVKNLPANCTIEYEDEDLKYSAVLTGRDSVLEALTVSSLGAYIDLAGLSQGSHTLEVKFALPSGVKLKKRIKATVILRGGEGSAAPIITETPLPEVTESPEP